MLELWPQRFRPALGAWKPAQNAGFHNPTATAATGTDLDDTEKPAKITGSSRFSCRTVLLQLKAEFYGERTVVAVWTGL
jgi:hypothetical protein